VDPVGVLKALTNHVTADGVLHVEVPDEVWGGLPLPHDAATHLNCFTKQTAEILLKLSGWRLIWSASGAGNYGEVAIAVTNVVARADRTTTVSDTEYAAASRDSPMRLHADTRLRCQHLQELASQVWLQASCMLREGHMVTNVKTIIDRVTRSTKTHG
jgi:hypothetical protein